MPSSTNATINTVLRINDVRHKLHHGMVHAPSFHKERDGDTRSQSSPCMKSGTTWRVDPPATSPKFKSKAEVVNNAGQNNVPVHVASLTDLCHLKHAEHAEHLDKYEGRVVMYEKEVVLQVFRKGRSSLLKNPGFLRKMR